MLKSSQSVMVADQLPSHVRFQELLARQNRESSTKGDAVKYLLEKSELVDQKDEDGETPLMNAADAGCVESVKILLSRDADVNAVSDLGWNALQLVKQYKDEDSAAIVELLVEAGAR